MNQPYLRSSRAKPAISIQCELTGQLCPYPACDHDDRNVVETEARFDERSRMGRELHESTAQSLVSLQLKVLYLEQMFDEPRYHELLGEVQETIRELHSEIRAVSLLSNGPLLEEGALPAALRSMAARFGKLTGLEISFRMAGAYRRIELATERSLFRMAQEALANVFRHAHARRAAISLETRPGQIRLEILDDGIGPCRNWRSSAGVGLDNVRSRVRELNGHFTLRQTVAGTKFLVSIPLVRSATAAPKVELSIAS